MDIELDAMFRRIERLEALIVDSGPEELNATVLDNLLKFNADMVNATNGRERIQTVFRKVDEIDRFLDPVWLDTKQSQSQIEKAEVILSEEANIIKMVEDLNELDKLRPVLESNAIEDAPNLSSKLGTIRACQNNLTSQVEAIIKESRNCLTEQTLMVRFIYF
ncbi:hypothetical protein QYM36_001017 [Artemia franciscana]|uniref:Uncharacterized protein n=1 Tax=Artemia franciscana TaxID=6661 RepID=A0AA88IBY9_ARTSF|nr:hypothetical protein QYM36_001017 [Artemia franciscana]